MSSVIRMIRDLLGLAQADTKEEARRDRIFFVGCLCIVSGVVMLDLPFLIGIAVSTALVALWGLTHVYLKPAPPDN